MDSAFWNWKRLGRVPTVAGESGFVKQGTTTGKLHCYWTLVERLLGFLFCLSWRSPTTNNNQSIAVTRSKRWRFSKAMPAWRDFPCRRTDARNLGLLEVRGVRQFCFQDLEINTKFHVPRLKQLEQTLARFSHCSEGIRQTRASSRLPRIQNRFAWINGGGMQLGALIEGAILLATLFRHTLHPGVNNSEKRVIEGLPFSAL